LNRLQPISDMATSASIRQPDAARSLEADRGFRRNRNSMSVD
jgi:hypothetical protein